MPELMQDDATPENLAQALLNQIGDKDIRARQDEVFLAIHRQLRVNSGERVLEALLPLLERKQRSEGALKIRTLTESAP